MTIGFMIVRLQGGGDIRYQLALLDFINNKTHEQKY